MQAKNILAFDAMDRYQLITQIPEIPILGMVKITQLFGVTMKSLLFILTLTFGLPTLATADVAANEVFVANTQYGLVVGHDSVNNSPCVYQTSTGEWKGEDVGHLNYGFNSDHELLNGLSPGHFNKQWFANRLVHAGPGLIEKVISGAVTAYRVEVDYNSLQQITAIRSYWDNSLDNECLFTWKN